MTKQNLFTEEELAKVTDEAERKHLIECAQDQSKIDMKYMEIMSKYDLWEKGKRSRYFHATTHENAKKIMQDGVIRKGMDGGVYICKQPLEAARFDLFPYLRKQPFVQQYLMCIIAVANFHNKNFLILLHQFSGFSFSKIQIICCLFHI